ncbi:MAG: class I SAM-dependent methyltransferase [Chloroflexota bacterium]|nr:class I SAM-dependent methyltransferase [Chloroflexota bacterium]
MVNWLARLYVWATYRLYYELAWAYDLVSWLVSLGHWAGWRRMALDHVTGHRILEVGFGTGELLIEMARRGLHVYGLEYSPAMQKITARKMRRKRISAPRVHGVVQKTPFVNESFDSIISTFPAGYILDPVTLREAARLLRRPDPSTATRGGRFIVVGMYFDTDNPFLRRAERLLFGAPVEGILSRYEQIATAAGLCTTVDTGNSKGLKVPVVISERCT